MGRSRFALSARRGFAASGRGCTRSSERSGPPNRLGPWRPGRGVWLLRRRQAFNRRGRRAGPLGFTIMTAANRRYSVAHARHRHGPRTTPFSGAAGLGDRVPRALPRAGGMGCALGTWTGPRAPRQRKDSFCARGFESLRERSISAGFSAAEARCNLPWVVGSKSRECAGSWLRRGLQACFARGTG